MRKREFSESPLKGTNTESVINQAKVLQKMKSTDDEAQIQGSAGNLLNSMQSKGSSKHTNDKNRSRFGKKKFADEPALTSGVKTSSKPEGSKKTKKKTASVGLDKEAKDLMKNLEAKIEELRKASFGETNRLEAMMEKDA